MEWNTEPNLWLHTGTYQLDQSGYYQNVDPNTNQGANQQQTDQQQQQPAQGGYDWSNQQQQQQYTETGTEAIPDGGGYQQQQTGGNYAQFGSQVSDV